MWPGAISRLRRNAFIDRWAGREWALRQHRAAVSEEVGAARRVGDVEEAPLFFGQDAGLINDVAPAGLIVETMVSHADEIISGVAGGAIGN